MSDDRPKVRGWWDYLELFLRHAAPFLTALTIALVGWFSKDFAVKAQLEETRRVEKRSEIEKEIANEAQNYRLYTELLSKREDAESALRRDMFMAILEKFFQVGTSEGSKADMDKQLLKLEMLALNFGESLSLSPLFIATDRAIAGLPDPSGKFVMPPFKLSVIIPLLART